MIEDEIFKKAKPDFDKIKNSGSKGFKKEGSFYKIGKTFMDGAFNCVIKIDEKGSIQGKVYDSINGEEYLPLRMEHSTGGFSSDVRAEYENILRGILKSFFVENHFVSNQANRITELIYAKSGISPDFPWKAKDGQKVKNPSAQDAGVFRKTKDGKWFALLMNIKKDRLIKGAKGEADILNLKLDEDEIQTLVKKEGFFPAYHMNKKYWITLILNETLSDDVIMKYVQESYNNVK